MEETDNYYKQSMDDIVFVNRNKDYGAYLLRTKYKFRLLKALLLSILFFVLGMGIPKVLSMLHFFDEPALELSKEKIMILAEIASSQPAFAPPPATKEKTEIVATSDPIPPSVPIKEKEDDKKQSNSGIDSSGNSKSNNQNNTGVYLSGRVEKEPTFIGGDEALESYMQNIVHPDITLKGTILVVFIINEKGEITDIKTDGKGNPKLEEAAKEAVAKMNGKWNPGIQNKIPVKVICKIPISF
ncbi:MAG: energy transducer TonB [Bacteroidota bacterium]